MRQKLDAEIKKIIQNALIEDQALNDVTSDLTIKKDTLIKFAINSREKIIFCGEKIITAVFSELKKSSKLRNSEINFKISAKDGKYLEAGKSICHGYGDAKLIFAAERLILNLIQHLSGISTTTNHFVKTLNNPRIKILDTRKTLPNLRSLQKYAVKTGGAQNHRFNLSDMILIKDNHIAAAGSVKNAISLAKKNNQKLKIEVECENIKQVEQAIKLDPDIIMLDNMTVSEIKKCSKIIRDYKKKKILIEISGGVNLKTLKNFNSLNIDFISIGSLTHSIRAVDIGLDVV